MGKSHSLAQEATFWCHIHRKHGTTNYCDFICRQGEASFGRIQVHLSSKNRFYFFFFITFSSCLNKLLFTNFHCFHSNALILIWSMGETSFKFQHCQILYVCVLFCIIINKNVILFPFLALLNQKFLFHECYYFKFYFFFFFSQVIFLSFHRV